MRLYAVAFALLYITQVVYFSNAILDKITNFLGIKRDEPTSKPTTKDEYLKALIELRLAQLEKNKQKQKSDTKYFDNLNRAKNNVTMGDIVMPPITVVVAKNKKALAKYQKKANESLTQDPSSITTVTGGTSGSSTTAIPKA